MYSPGWSLTHKNVPAFTSIILGLKLCATLFGHALCSFVPLTIALSCALAFLLLLTSPDKSDQLCFLHPVFTLICMKQFWKEPTYVTF